MEDRVWYHCLSSFWIKVLALSLMTLDHVAKFMIFYQVAPEAANVLQIVGRLGFPLFILMIAEGVRHTHHFGKYILRLSILGVAVLLGQIIIHYCFMDIYGFYSPIIDLILVALTLYFVKQWNKKSFLALIPVSIIVLSFVVNAIEIRDNIEIWWFPFYLRSGYNIYALLLGLCFYFAPMLTKLIIRNFGNGVENLEGTHFERLVINTVMIFGLFLATLIIYLLALLPGGDVYDIAIQSYSGCAAGIIFFYSGKLGYNKKWFKYGSYVYFPLHIAIIFVIFQLI